VLFKAGDQVPFILLLDFNGRLESDSPLQIAGTALNVGSIFD